MSYSDPNADITRWGVLAIAITLLAGAVDQLRREVVNMPRHQPSAAFVYGYMAGALDEQVPRVDPVAQGAPVTRLPSPEVLNAARRLARRVVRSEQRRARSGGDTTGDIDGPWNG